MAVDEPHETAELALSGSTQCAFPTRPLTTLRPLFPASDSFSDESLVPTDAACRIGAQQEEVGSRTRRSGDDKYRTTRVTSPVKRLPRDRPCSDEQVEEEEAEADKLELNPNIAVKTVFCTVRVPPNTVYLVERSGCFHRILESGTRLLIPGLDKVAYVFSQKLQKLTFTTSNVYTSDRIVLTVSCTLFYSVQDPVTAAYSILDMRGAMIDVATAAIHHRYARISIRLLFADLNSLWEKLTDELDATYSIWGVKLVRCFTANQLPSNITATYERLAQVRLQREIEEVSHETKPNHIPVSQSKKAAHVAHDETSEIQGIVMKGKANARAMKEIALALGEPNGKEAAKVWITSKYIDTINRSGPIDPSGPARVGGEALNEALKFTLSSVIPPTPGSSSSALSVGKRGKPGSSTSRRNGAQPRRNDGPIHGPKVEVAESLEPHLACKGSKTKGIPSSSEGTDSDFLLTDNPCGQELRNYAFSNISPFFEERSSALETTLAEIRHEVLGRKDILHKSPFSSSMSENPT